MNLCKRYILTLMILIMFLLPGCRGSGPVYHINPDVDFSFFKKVAVMPLDNLTGERNAGEIIKQVLISELLASGLVDVVIPGEVMTVINDLGIQNISSLDKKEMNAIGRALNVEALIMGSVEQYGVVRDGSISASEVTITLMMAEIETGNIVWSITLNRGGISFMARHFGAKTETMSEAVQGVVREAVRTLGGY